MHEKAYGAQCAAVQVHSNKSAERRNRHLTLFALGFGTFCIGTSEFASMGVIQLFSASLRVSLPTASNAITAYALGVVAGAPLITLAAAGLNRRGLLLCLMALFTAGNLLSAAANSFDLLIAARFVAGLPQGAYFGAGAVVATYIVGQAGGGSASAGGKAFAIVMAGLTIATIVGSPLATFLGQNFGWRDTYLTVSCMAVLSFVALWLWVPRTKALQGGPVLQELRALRRLPVWAMMAAAALCVASIFAVYTFIGPFVTDVAHLGKGWIPVALALFGVGMTAGNLIGGHLADGHPTRGLVVGFGSALAVLAVLACFGTSIIVLLAGLFGVGMTMMIGIPTIQVRLTQWAPEAPTLMGAMNLASLNVANAIGAWAGAATIALGVGLLSTVWAGFALTLAGLVLFAFTLPRPRQLAPA